MAERHDVTGVGRAGDLALSEDEIAVIKQIRKARYGEVIVGVRKGAIVTIRRNECMRPPSLSRQEKLPNG